MSPSNSPATTHPRRAATQAPPSEPGSTAIPCGGSKKAKQKSSTPPPPSPTTTTKKWTNPKPTPPPSPAATPAPQSPCPHLPSPPPAPTGPITAEAPQQEASSAKPAQHKVSSPQPQRTKALPNLSFKAEAANDGNTRMEVAGGKGLAA